MSDWENEEKRSYDVDDLRQEYRESLYAEKGAGKMSEREDGPYWVRAAGKWHVALWSNCFAPLGWELFGSDSSFQNDDFDEIGPRIPEPERKG